MLSITKGEVWSVLNLLKEIRDGTDPDDVEQDLQDNIELLESLLPEHRDNG